MGSRVIISIIFFSSIVTKQRNHYLFFHFSSLPFSYGLSKHTIRLYSFVTPCLAKSLFFILSQKKKVSLFYLFFIILSLVTRQLCNCLKHLKILITKQINSFLVITNKLCKHKLCWCSLNSFFF